MINQMALGFSLALCLTGQQTTLTGQKKRAWCCFSSEYFLPCLFLSTAETRPQTGAIPLFLEQQVLACAKWLFGEIDLIFCSYKWLVPFMDCLVTELCLAYSFASFEQAAASAWGLLSVQTVWVSISSILQHFFSFCYEPVARCGKVTLSSNWTATLGFSIFLQKKVFHHKSTILSNKCPVAPLWSRNLICFITMVLWANDPSNFAVMWFGSSLGSAVNMIIWWHFTQCVISAWAENTSKE